MTATREEPSVSDSRMSSSASKSSLSAVLADEAGAVPYGPPMMRALNSSVPGLNAVGQSWKVVLPLATGLPVAAKVEKEPE